jgi:hypothetical protein
MKAPHQSTDSLKHSAIIQLRRPTAPALKERKSVASMMMEADAIKKHRWHGWNLSRNQFGQKSMLFQDRLITPAPRTIKLGDHETIRAPIRPAILNTNLINAVLEAIKCHEPTIAPRTDCLDGIHHRFWH